MQAPAAIVALPLTNPLDILMASVNSNPYFIGIMMLLLNLGGRFLSLEISKDQEKILSMPVVRRFFLFAILFVATRNVVIAGGLAIIVILCIGYLFNENSDLCLWKNCIHKSTEGFQESYTGLTSEETMIYKSLQAKKNAGSPEKILEEKPAVYSLYNSAIKQISAI
jgi:hypothetical protein